MPLFLIFLKTYSIQINGVFFYIFCCKSWVHLFYNFSNVLSEILKYEGMHLQIALAMMTWRNIITSASKISYTAVWWLPHFVGDCNNQVLFISTLIRRSRIQATCTFARTPDFKTLTVNVMINLFTGKMR